MKISLERFEKEIDPVILRRGLQYYEDGNVIDVEEIYSGDYEAIVEGAENYKVSLKIVDGIVEYYDCTCPYDMGPVCKHVVAVLYCICEMLMEYTTYVDIDVDEKESEVVVKKAKTVNEQVTEIVSRLSEEELREFVKSSCLKEKKIRSMLMLKFATRYTHLS